jgi:hypothetical protein
MSDNAKLNEIAAVSEAQGSPRKDTSARSAVSHRLCAMANSETPIGAACHSARLYRKQHREHAVDRPGQQRQVRRQRQVRSMKRLARTAGSATMLA